MKTKTEEMRRTNRKNSRLKLHQEDVKKSKHALCKCLVNNDGMRKHNISGVFFSLLTTGRKTTRC